MTFSLLQITNGTQRVNLLSKQYGFTLKQWMPSLSQPKDGGVWSSSPLEDGRRPIMKTMDNITDGFLLSLTAPDVDDAIEELQDLRSLLDQAVGYWLNDIATNPVWIEACGVGETSKRYAIIYDYRTPQDPDSYSDPFAKRTSLRSMIQEFPLILEHGMWSDSQPKTGHPLPLSGLSPHVSRYDAIIAATINSGADDVSYREQEGVASATDATFFIGLRHTGAASTMGSCGVALRYSSLNIPKGAKITYAYLYFKAAATIGSTLVARVLISGEKSPNSRALNGTFVDVKSRIRTNNTTRFVINTLWTFGNWYSSVDISSIIQELVDQDGWNSGNPSTLFVENDPDIVVGYEFGRDVYGYETAPSSAVVLYVRYSSGVNVPGIEKSSNRKMFVANQHSRSQISHIYTGNAGGGGFSGNLLSQSLPYTLIGAGASVAILYFGSCDPVTLVTHFTGYGPFNNIVMDLLLPAGGYTEVLWEYWNGTIWYDIFERDNSNIIGKPAFSIDGVVSFHWRNPSDWVVTAVNGITGWWVRARYVSGTDAQQQNRHPFTLVVPYLDISKDDVLCDIAPTARIGIQNISSNGLYNGLPYAYDNSRTWANRILVASRSLDRGQYFTPYINTSDRQNNPNITVELTAGSSSFINTSSACSSRLIEFVSGGVLPLTYQYKIIIGDLISKEYIGRYRMFLRGIQISGTVGDVSVKAYVYLGGISIYTSPEVYTNSINNGVDYIGFMDLGILSSIGAHEGKISDSIEIRIYMSAKINNTFRSFDLVLFPIDEYVGDFIDSNTTPEYGFIGGYGRYRRQLDVDSISNPKEIVSSVVVLKPSGFGEYSTPEKNTIFTTYSSIQSGRTYIQKESDQRLWFFACRMAPYPGVRYWVSNQEICLSVEVDIVKHYFSMRGKK